MIHGHSRVLPQLNFKLQHLCLQAQTSRLNKVSASHKLAEDPYVLTHELLAAQNEG